MSAELLLVFLPVRITVEREILTVRKIFRFDKILLSPSQQTPGTRKNVNFENRRYGFSSYNSMSAELLLVFLPVRITVEREISTVRTIFRFDKILLSPRQTPGTSEISSISKNVDPVH